MSNHFAIAVICLALVACSTPSAGDAGLGDAGPSDSGACGGSPVFCDDYTNPSLASAYTTYNGNWERMTGSYSVTDSTAWERARATLADDISDFDLTITGNTEGDYGFGIVYAGSANQSDGYAVLVQPAQFQGIYLKQLVPGQLDVEISNTPLSAGLAGTSMVLRVKRQGSQVTAWLNGTQMISASDNSNGASGRLGLLMSDTNLPANAGAVFSLFRVDSASAASTSSTTTSSSTGQATTNTSSTGTSGSGTTGGSTSGGNGGGPCGGEAVPAEASAAGFSTCAYDYDFSQPLYATESNWLDWDNTNPAVAWHNGWPGGLSHFPDGYIYQTKDPAYGQTVLDMQWSTSFNGQQTGNNSFLSMQTVMNGGGANAVTFPNYYAEMIYRIDNKSAVAPQAGENVSGPDGVWTWQVGGGYEFDFAELYGYAGGFGDSGRGAYDWVSYESGAKGNANIPSGWSPTEYHKYGGLFTSDGNTSVASCSWIDDVFQGCNSQSPSDFPNWLVIWVGAYESTNTPTTNLYVQYVRVWSCGDWQNSKCDGSTLVQNQENGTTLSYWK